VVVLDRHPDAVRPGPAVLNSHRVRSESESTAARRRSTASHPEQGWSLLCNGIVLFDDGGLAPARRPRRGAARAALSRDRGM